MIANRIIVCIGNAWDDDPTSKHHVMRLLAQRNDVVWINYRGTRRPTASAADLRAAAAAVRRMFRGIQRIDDSIIQVTPFVLPGASTRLARALNRRLLIAQVRRAVASVQSRPRRPVQVTGSGGTGSGGMGPCTRGPVAARGSHGCQSSASPTRPVQIWTFAPDVPFLRGCLDEECFVFYCTDDYSRFDGVDRESILAAESETIARADLVVATSEELWKSRRGRRADAELVRHGVDYEHFASAWRNPPPTPADIADIPRPIFGFFGLIHHWIDRELLAEVAQLRPRYSFVIIGEHKVEVAALAGLPNVHLLGRRHYAELPAYCTAFSAGLLPFARTAMTRNINPIKLHEYLAAGLPVVSTPLPEAERLGGPVAIAETPEAFAAACDAVAMKNSASASRDISALVADRSWSTTVEHLSNLVMSRVGRGRPRQSRACQSRARKEAVFSRAVPEGRNEDSPAIYRWDTRAR